MRRHELLEALRVRYRRARLSDKIRIVTEFAAVTGYSRKRAARLLRDQVRSAEATSRPERRIYDEAVREVLVELWEVSDRIVASG